MEKVYNSEEWNSEIRCLPLVKGISYFIKERINNKDSNFDEFIKDATDIQEIRGLLHENWDNRPKPIANARDFHYIVFGKGLDSMLNIFADTYVLRINRD